MEKRLLVVFAHPDDESFGPAGTLTHYVKAGVRVRLLTATRGEAGKNATGRTEEPLGAMREKELLKAAEILGLEKVDFMGYIDKTLQDLVAFRPIEKIVNYIDDFQPQVVLTFGPTGISKHPDHMAVHHWATRAFKMSKSAQKLYYVTLPVDQMRQRYPELPDGEGEIAAILDVSQYREIKKAAIMCHETQRFSMERIFDFAGGNRPIPDKEYFILADHRLDDYQKEGIEDDLFQGVDLWRKEQV